MALRRGGEAVDEPYKWWDSLSEEAIQFWHAYWQVEPFGAEWEQVAMVSAMLDAVYAATLNPNVEKADRHKPRGLEDFLPVHAYRQPKDSKPNKQKLLSKLDKLAGLRK